MNRVHEEEIMGWLAQLFGKAPSDDRLDRLVRRLIFYSDENTVLDALREATELAPRGDDLGVRALAEAIRRRSGRRRVSFYEPQLGTLTVRSGTEFMEAGDRLLELATSHRLLDDPAASQNLMSAALSALGSDGLSELVMKIFALAGREQGYDFQLLFNQMHSSIKLRHTRGERTWTQLAEGAP